MLMQVETKAAKSSTKANAGSSMGNDPAMALIRALIELSQSTAALQFHEGHDWASATFSGMRHRLALIFTGTEAISAGNILAEQLEAHEFTLKRHVVIDIHVAHRVERHEGEPTLLLEIEALTVEDS